MFDFPAFNSIGEMQRNLSSGDIGRVLVDRNTAFHFLDKSGLKRNRQIRLIRHIDYPMDYYMVHVNREIEGSSEEYFEETFMSPSYNDTDEAPAKPGPEEQKQQIAQCGPWLKEMSKDLIGAAKQRAAEQVIPAELQVHIFAHSVFEFVHIMQRKQEINPCSDSRSYEQRSLLYSRFLGCHATRCVTSQEKKTAGDYEQTDTCKELCDSFGRQGPLCY